VFVYQLNKVDAVVLRWEYPFLCDSRGTVYSVNTVNNVFTIDLLPLVENEKN